MNDTASGPDHAAPEDPRAELAADRTLFAAERTYTAWVRTGLTALASGVGAGKLLSGSLPLWLIVGIRAALVLFSLFCFWAAVWREFHQGAPPPKPDTPRLSRVALIAVNVGLALVAAAALIAIAVGAGAG